MRRISVTIEADKYIDFADIADALDEEDVRELCDQFGIELAGDVESEDETIYEVSPNALELCEIVERLIGSWAIDESSDIHRARLLITDIRSEAKE